MFNICVNKNVKKSADLRIGVILIGDEKKFGNWENSLDFTSSTRAITLLRAEIN